ncbi:MAG TPA: adenine deaminase C-terminal domain-containing protein [Opitutaceae bacterium]|nr:adenine deaminase C-terminal domain-containing protein [Opitutaceae bacterium]
MKTRTLSGTVVDVENREMFAGTIEWADGVICAIHRDRRSRGPGLIMPGFVDAHIHIESSLLPPAEFARLAVVHGTVATVSDPHEIANVLGVAGVDYMIRDGARTPFKFNFGAPSCVPATTFETAGASLDAAAVDALLDRPEIRYLSEVMNFPGVLAGDPGMLAKIESAHRRGKQVDGHAPGLRGARAAAYAAAGITTDHECITLEEARDKLDAGMRILIREGSAARNFDALAPLLKTDASHCMFCCDDLHPDLLVKHHIDHHVRRALNVGANRFDVLACASVHAVQHYGLDVGLLQPGDPADFIVVDNWSRFRVQRTYLRGELVASNGRTRLARRPSRIVNRFRARPRKAGDFALTVPASAERENCGCGAVGTGRTSVVALRVSAGIRIPPLTRRATLSKPVLNVIQAIDGQLVTRHERMEATIVDGLAVADPKRDLLKIAVVNRYEPRAPVAVSFVQGFGLRRGAIASSVAHDSHNIVAVGVDDASLATAVNLVIKGRGGMSVAEGARGSVLPLPIAGLMSDLDGRTVARRYAALDAKAKRLGSRLGAPFMTLSFMALLVIPDLKLSDRGLFSGSKWAMEPLFAE